MPADSQKALFHVGQITMS